MASTRIRPDLSMIKFNDASCALQRLLDVVGSSSFCKHCNEPIVWVRTSWGNAVSLDMDLGFHSATCISEWGERARREHESYRCTLEKRQKRKEMRRLAKESASSG